MANDATEQYHQKINFFILQNAGTTLISVDQLNTNKIKNKCNNLHVCSVPQTNHIDFNKIRSLNHWKRFFNSRLQMY